MKIFDTHSHIYLEDFDKDREEVIARAQEAGICNIMLPNIDLSSIQRVKELTQSNPSLFSAALGIHPESIGINYQEELEQIKRAWDPTIFCAIGEIGIDAYWDKTFLREQADAFEKQVQWAIELNKPIIIHVRQAWDETLEIMESYHQKTSGIFHCFSGSEQELKKILSWEKFYIGINGIITYKKSTLPQICPLLPIERVTIETDAPYLSPEPKRGKRNEPSYLNFILKKISSIYNIEEEKLSEIIYSTSVNLFHPKNGQVFPF